MRKRTEVNLTSKNKGNTKLWREKWFEFDLLGYKLRFYRSTENVFIKLPAVYIVYTITFKFILSRLLVPKWGNEIWDEHKIQIEWGFRFGFVPFQESGWLCARISEWIQARSVRDEPLQLLIWNYYYRTFCSKVEMENSERRKEIGRTSIMLLNQM